MGQLAIATAGAVVGGVIGSILPGGGTMIGASIGWAVGSAVGGIVYGAKQKAKDNTGPQIGDLSVQSAALGAGIPIIFGQWEVAGNVIWIGPLTMNGNPVTSGSGQAPQDDGDGSGKGGGGGGSPGDPVYKCSFAVALCEGPIDAPLKVYADGKIIADFTNTGYFSGPDFENLITYYTGDESQLPDPTIEAVEGVGNVPAFRGTAYLVFKNFPLANFGNRIPNISVEVLSTSTQANPVNNVSLSGTAPVADNHVLSKNALFLYVKHGDYISKIDRSSSAVILSRDLKTAIEATNKGDGSGEAIGEDGAVTLQTTAKIWLSEVDDAIYVAAEQAGLLFLVEIDPITLLPRLTSWATKKTVTAGSVDGIAVGGGTSVTRIYTADFTGAKIRYYGRGSSLAQGWERSGPHASAVPGNFVYVGVYNCVYMISQRTGIGNKDFFYISKITEEGYVTHYTINGTDYRCKQVAYDHLANALICGGGDTYLIKLDLLGGGVVNTVPSQATASRSNGSLRSCFISQARISSQAFLTAFNANIYIINTRDFSIIKSYSSASWGSPTLNGFSRDYSRNSFWVADPAFTRMRELMADRLGPDTVTLGQVVSAICTKAGFTGSQIDVTQLTDVIKGFAIPRQMNARAALDPLQKAFLFDSVETGITGGYGIKFIKQGGASIATIPEDDLGVTEESQESIDRVIETVVQEAEVPRVCIVRYVDPERGYEAGSQQFRRRLGIVSTTAELVIELPIALSDEVAKQLAEKHLYQAWTERKSVDIQIGPKWLHLDGGDVITINKTSSSISYVGRLVQAEDGGNYIRKIKALIANSAVLTPSAAGPVIPFKPIGTLRPIAPTWAEIFDTAIMRGSDDNEGYYFAAAPIGAGEWQGANVQKSLDNQAYSNNFTVSRASTMGVVESALPIADVRHTETDLTSTMRVRMIYGTLSSKTRLEVLNGANLAIVGKEIIQFQNATEVSTGVYDIDTIFRGRFGTNWDIPNRAIGEPFVLVDVTTVRRVIPAIHELNQYKPIRVSTFRQKLDTARRKDIKHEGNGMKPLSPCKFRGGTPDNSDFQLYWYRRTRVGGEQVDGVKEVPLAEETEAYEVDLFSDADFSILLRTMSVAAPPDITASFSVSSVDQSYNRLSGSFIDDGYIVGMQLFTAGFSNAVNNNYSKVVSVQALKMIVEKRGTHLGDMITEGAGSRTLTAMNPGLRYTEAQQIVDGGAVVDLYAKVYQMSARVGRGFPEEGHFINTSI